jgi:hypothetical protein
MQTGPRVFASVLLVAAISLHAASLDICLVANRTNVPARIEGLASDGTNVMAAQCDTNGVLSLQPLTANGEPLGNSIPIASNVASARIGFGYSKYFVAWLSTTGTVMGCKIDSAGNPEQQPFTMSVPGEQIGSLGNVVISSTSFVVAWDSVTISESTNSQIWSCWVSANGDGFSRFPLSETDTSRRFPSLSPAHGYLLGVWFEWQTNSEWAVVGNLMDKDGWMPRPSFRISETNSLVPRRIAAAFGGTNHLVVWTRETGPYRHEFGFGNPFTNSYYACLFGRVITSTGNLAGAEFQITRQRWAQDNPALGFDGRDFVLAWRDYRYSELYLNSYYGTDDILFLAHPNLWARQITTAGALKNHEFSLNRAQMVGEVSITCWSGSSVIAASQMNYDCAPFCWGYAGNGSDVYSVRRADAPRIQSMAARGDAFYSVVSLDSQSATATLESSTNLLNWTPLSGAAPLTNGANTWSAGMESLRFYRAKDDRPTCIDQLRMIEWAKFQTMVDAPWRTLDFSPDVYEIWGPSGSAGGYLPRPYPVCPAGGAYILNSFGSPPSCTIPNHSLSF